MQKNENKNKNDTMFVHVNLQLDFQLDIKMPFLVNELSASKTFDDLFSTLSELHLSRNQDNECKKNSRLVNDFRNKRQKEKKNFFRTRYKKSKKNSLG